MNQLLRASLAASTIVAAATAQDYWAGGSPWSRPWQLWGLEQQLFTSSNNQAAQHVSNASYSPNLLVQAPTYIDLVWMYEGVSTEDHAFGYFVYTEDNGALDIVDRQLMFRSVDYNTSAWTSSGNGQLIQRRPTTCATAAATAACSSRATASASSSCMTAASSGARAAPTPRSSSGGSQVSR